MWEMFNFKQMRGKNNSVKAVRVVILQVCHKKSHNKTAYYYIHDYVETV